MTDFFNNRILKKRRTEKTNDNPPSPDSDNAPIPSAQDTQTAPRPRHLHLPALHLPALHLHRPSHLPRLIIAAALLLAAAACAIAAAAVPRSFRSQQAAQDWRGSSDTDFAQISRYFPLHEGVSSSDVYTFRTKLDEALTAASLAPSENGSLWVDCWSTEAGLSVKGDTGTAECAAYAVGGQFFYFHPLRLLNGAWFSESDLMQDRVILDHTLAWKLFGATELAGMTVMINDLPFYVAGVVELDDDRYSRLTNPDSGCIFLSFDALTALKGESDPPQITSYEVILPDVVDGFARSIVADGLAAGVGATVENSSRFTPRLLWRVIADYGQRVMRNDGVIFPAWENSARCAENQAALLMLAACALAAFPAVLAAVTLVSALRKCKRPPLMRRPRTT